MVLYPYFGIKITDMSEIYPLKFKPLLMEKIWGGTKIGSFLKEAGKLKNCGEAWVLSGVQGNQTMVSEGFLKDNELNELVEVYMGDLVGDKVYDEFGDEFPILVKLIDSGDYLSVQVHPNDILARKRHGSRGKTEMWYIMEAEPDAEIITGFERKVSPEEFMYQLSQKKIRDILHKEKVTGGDVLFTPAGRVHALGAGILLAEIQQTSDITYRIYDWDRTDAKGHSRELHTELAMEAIDFEIPAHYKTEYQVKENGTTPLIQSVPFVTNLISTRQSLKKDYSELDSFVIYLCLEGSFSLFYNDGKVDVAKGEAVLVPALIDSLGIIPRPFVKILEVYIH